MSDNEKLDFLISKVGQIDLLITMMGQFDSRLKQTHRAVLDMRVDLEEAVLTLNNKLDIHNVRLHS
jgi:hypothetical protein